MKKAIFFAVSIYTLGNNEILLGITWDLAHPSHIC